MAGKASPEADLGHSFGQPAAKLGALDEQQRLVSLAYAVFEQPGSTEAWLKAPHPLLQQASPLQHCRTAIGAGQVRRLLLTLEQGAPM